MMNQWKENLFDDQQKIRERAEYLERLMKSIWDLLFISEELVKSYSDQIAEMDIEKMIRLSADGIRSFVPTTFIAYYKIDEESFEFQQKLVLPEEYREECSREVDLLIEKGHFGWGIRQNEISTFKPTVLSHGIAKSIFFIPMVSGMNLHGALLVFSTVDGQEMKQEGFRLIEYVCRQISFTIENVSLYSNLNRQHRELEQAYSRVDKQMQQLSMLYDVGNALNFIDDLTRLLSMIIDQALKILEAREGILMLLDEKGRDLVIRVIRGIDAETEEKVIRGEAEGTRLPVGDGMLWTIFREKKPLAIEDEVCDVPFHNLTGPISNMLGVPLLVHGDSIGLICITNKKSNKAFSREDQEVISALASQAAVAINNAKLYDMAITDGLTKLYIRRFFLQRLSDELIRSRRYKHNLTLFVTDIDHFKHFNDNYGHQAGDAVLYETAKALKSMVRLTDIVCRYGGEEFCVLLTETPFENAQIVSERIRAGVEAMDVHFSDLTLKVTMSIGVASYPEHADTVESLIRCADLALYRAKETGRNRVCTYEEIKDTEVNAETQEQDHQVIDANQPE